MEKYFFKRWYASDDSGRQLFYIEIYGDIYSDFYFVESSLPDIIFNRVEFLPLINQICKVEIEISERAKIVELFIDKIKHVPEVDQYYFPNSLLNNKGQYSESYARTIEEIISNPVVKKMTPYSIHCNEIIFDELTKEYSNEEEHSSMAIEKNEFEKQLNGNIVLQNAYLDVYNCEASYFYGYEVIESLHLECYFMTIAGKIVFMFFTEISESQCG